MVINDECNLIRYVAVGRIRNQDILDKVAIKDKDVNVRIAPIEKIKHENILNKIATN